MARSASPWHEAHDLPLPSSLRRQAVSPSLTHSMAGFRLSSRCIACVDGPMNVAPDSRCAAAARLSSAHSMKKRTRMALSGSHRDVGRFGLGKVVVPFPGKGELAAFGGHRMEDQVGIGGDCRKQLGAEYQFAVVAAT